MPVQLPNSTFLQMLLSSGDVMALRKVLKDLLSRPAAWEQSRLGVGKAPFDIGNEAVVGAGGTEMVRVLEVQGFIRATFLSSELAKRTSDARARRTAYPGEERLCLCR